MTILAVLTLREEPHDTFTFVCLELHLPVPDDVFYASTPKYKTPDFSPSSFPILVNSTSSATICSPPEHPSTIPCLH